MCQSQTLNFRKSSYSATRNECIEVADLATSSAVRDSQHPENGYIMFPAVEWQAFLSEIKDSQF